MPGIARPFMGSLRAHLLLPNNSPFLSAGPTGSLQTLRQLTVAQEAVIAAVPVALAGISYTTLKTAEAIAEDVKAIMDVSKDAESQLQRLVDDLKESHRNLPQKSNLPESCKPKPWCVGWRARDGCKGALGPTDWGDLKITSCWCLCDETLSGLCGSIDALTEAVRVANDQLQEHTSTVKGLMSTLSDGRFRSDMAMGAGLAAVGTGAGAVMAAFAGPAAAPVLLVGGSFGLLAGGYGGQMSYENKQDLRSLQEDVNKATKKAQAMSTELAILRKELYMA